jgi:hypothetical protein
VCSSLCGGRWVVSMDPAYVILSHFGLCIFSGDVNNYMFASCQALDSGHGFVLFSQLRGRTYVYAQQGFAHFASLIVCPLRENNGLSCLRGIKGLVSLITWSLTLLTATVSRLALSHFGVAK